MNLVKYEYIHERLKFSRQLIMKMVENKRFPKPVLKTGPARSNAVYWNQSDIDSWIEAKLGRKV